MNNLLPIALVFLSLRFVNAQCYYYCSTGPSSGAIVAICLSILVICIIFTVICSIARARRRRRLFNQTIPFVAGAFQQPTTMAIVQPGFQPSTYDQSMGYGVTVGMPIQQPGFQQPGFAFQPGFQPGYQTGYQPGFQPGSQQQPVFYQSGY